MNDPRLQAIVEMVQLPQVRITALGNAIAIDYNDNSELIERRGWVADAAKALGTPIRRSGAARSPCRVRRTYCLWSAYVEVED